MAKTKVHGEYLKDSVVRFTAKAGENITKGQAVYISGISGEVSVVSLADANDTAKMPAFGLAEATVSTNAEVEITSFGTLKGLDTSSFSLGDILYVDTTAGSLTNNPSGLEATKLQNIGIVQRVHATSGSIKVGGAGRTNAVPNLDDGDIFIGDSNNKAVSDSFTNVLNTEAGINSSADATAITIDSSENIGIGTASPVNNGAGSQGLTINGTGNYQNLNLQVNGTTQFTIYTNGTSGTFINQVTADPMMFYTSDTERMRIDSGGRVMIAETSNSGYSANADDLIVGNNGAATERGISIGSTAGGGIRWNDGADAGIIQYAHSSNAMQFYTANSLAATIDSSGSTTFDTGTNDGVKITGAENGAYIDSSFIADVNTKGSFIGIKRPEDGNVTVHGIGTYDSVGNTKNNLAITSRSDIVFAGNDGEMGRFLGAGGLCFNGDTAAANALDDYEEGTWTPNYSDASGNTSNAATSQTGTYTKIGNLVSVQGYFYQSGSPTGMTATDNLTIVGLPFTNSSTHSVGTIRTLDVFARQPTNRFTRVYLSSGGDSLMVTKNNGSPNLTSGVSNWEVSAKVDDIDSVGANNSAVVFQITYTTS